MAAKHATRATWVMPQDCMSTQEDCMSTPKLPKLPKLLAWSPCGKFIATSDWNRIAIIERASGKAVRRFILITGAPRVNISALSWSPDSQQLAFGVDSSNLIGFVVVVPWSDKTHRLFSPQFRHLVMLLMCIRQRQCHQNQVSLPIELWLKVFDYLETALAKTIDFGDEMNVRIAHFI